MFHKMAVVVLFVAILICMDGFAEGRIITVPAGHDVILPCQAPSNYRRPYDAVEWIREGKETEHVFVFRDGKPVPVIQLPSYQNRADLQDRKMKDGDVSLVLKNVKTDDTGTYECRVKQGGGNRRKRNADPPIISIVHLEVSPPPPSEQTNITVTAGDDAMLPCRAPPGYTQPYDAVEWSRGEGQETKDVFLLRDGKSDPDDQLPSYQNRVDLQDRKMKDGDVSLVLKDVTTDDTGTYGCRVKQGEGTRRKRDIGPPIISIVHLEVSPGRKHPALIVGLSAAGIIVMAAAGVWIYKKKKISAPPPQSDSGEKDAISSAVDQTDQLCSM